MAAIGKSSERKVTEKKKKKPVTFERGTTRRGKQKKKYTTGLSDNLARAKKAMTSDKAYALPFGETFKQARKTGKETFRWKSKQYSTKTKAELEGAIGAKEKERFARAGKAKEAAPAKKGFFAKLKSLGSPVKGREERVKAKRIASMEKRKEEGKSYSKKNLAELKGSKTIPKAKDFAGFITKKKKKTYSVSS